MVALCFGTAVYVLFSRVPALVPVGEWAEPWLVDALPVLLFALLFVTFCKIDVRDMRLRAWHVWLQVIRLVLCGLLVFAVVSSGTGHSRLVWTGVFVCVSCPTAAAAAVVTEKLGGSIASMTIYTIMDNLVTAIAVPLFLPMVERGVGVSFVEASLMVLRNVALVLVAPLVLALVCRREWTFRYSGRPCFFRISLNRQVKVEGVMGRRQPLRRNRKSPSSSALPS